jgi:hypothetical protein
MAALGVFLGMPVNTNDFLQTKVKQRQYLAKQ